MTDIGPGTRVECINDDWGDTWTGDPAPADAPVKGKIYTVDGFCPSYRDYLLLAECQSTRSGHLPYYYSRKHFRPIRDTKKGMSILRKAVKDALKDVRVDA